MYRKTAEQLLRFIEKSPCSFFAVRNLKRQLDAAGFSELREERPWDLRSGGRYYVTRNGSSILAFRLPKGPLEGFQMTASHSDAPAFQIKEHPELGVEGHYVKLNVEKYGGMLCAPWLDRPLSVAGRVLVQEDHGVAARLVDLKRDIALIPNLAIHMNREANSGFAYQPQTDLLPLFGGDGASGRFLALVADAAGTSPEHVLATELFLYNREPGTIWGADGEFLSSRALDDLQCAYATMQGFLRAADNPRRGTLCAVFDNEEVGSGTKQGADGTFFADTLERICGCLGMGV